MIKYAFLLLVSLLLGLVLLPILFVYALIVRRLDKNRQGGLLYLMAVNIDIMGNINGDLIHHLIAKDWQKFHLFGLPGITISASTGHLIETNNINNIGLRFSHTLDKCFKEKDHCLNAYNSLVLKESNKIK